MPKMNKFLKKGKKIQVVLLIWSLFLSYVAVEKLKSLLFTKQNAAYISQKAVVKAKHFFSSNSVRTRR